MRDEELLSMKDAATRKGVPVNDIRKGIESGDLPAVERGSAWFIRPDDLDRWVPHPKTAAGADYTDSEAAEALRTPGTPS